MNHANPPCNGGGSQDSIDELDAILSQAFTDGASDTMWQNDRHVEIFATAKERLLAWHNTQLKAAEANAVEKWCASLFAVDPVLKAKLEAAMQAKLE